MVAQVGKHPVRNDTSTATSAKPSAAPRPTTAAIMGELRSQVHAVAGDRRPEPWVLRQGDAIMVAGSASTVRGRMVAAAVDDDHNPGPVLRYAAAEALRLGVPMRVVHVWTEDASPLPSGLRRHRHDRMCDADQLLADVLYECLPVEDADAAERQILHDPDPVRALVALSAEAAELVVGVRGDGTREGVLGATVRRLVGNTACPLAVLPEPEGYATMAVW